MRRDRVRLTLEISFEGFESHETEGLTRDVRSWIDNALEGRHGLTDWTYPLVALMPGDPAANGPRADLAEEIVSAMSPTHPEQAAAALLDRYTDVVRKQAAAALLPAVRDSVKSAPRHAAHELRQDANRQTDPRVTAYGGTLADLIDPDVNS